MKRGMDGRGWYGREGWMDGRMGIFHDCRFFYVMMVGEGLDGRGGAVCWHEVQEMEDVILTSLSVGLGLGLMAMEGGRWR